MLQDKQIAIWDPMEGLAQEDDPNWSDLPNGRPFKFATRKRLSSNNLNTQGAASPADAPKDYLTFKRKRSYVKNYEE